MVPSYIQGKIQLGFIHKFRQQTNLNVNMSSLIMKIWQQVQPVPDKDIIKIVCFLAHTLAVIICTSMSSQLTSQ